MKKFISCVLVCALLCSLFVGCSNEGPDMTDPNETKPTTEPIVESTEPSVDINVVKPGEVDVDGIKINLSDEKITVNGADISTDKTHDVYVTNDIVYYEDGKDFTYGEGEESDAHSKEEADKHQVIHITKAGTYVLSGELTAGQIAIDLGDEAESDETAVVTLYLNGVDITCSVAPAIIFYNVYECGSTDTETASAVVDTSAAGANVVIVDDSVNIVNGSHVARIYKEGTVVLNEDGTEVEDAKKLHKYDAAFYSKQTMNVNGGNKGNGILNIKADNEGLDTELHLTINGGVIYINAGNDGINTNEDNVSVTTISGGEVNIIANGSTGEGDGIDSNGWLVINGGIVRAQACAISGDAGIDSDMGIQINGGTVFATGNMLDMISESKQTFAVFNFSKSQRAGTYVLKNSDNKVIAEYDVNNDFMYLIISDPDMVAGEYTLWCGETQFAGVKTEDSMGGMRPGGDKMPNGEKPEDFDPNKMPPDELKDKAENKGDGSAKNDKATNNPGSDETAPNGTTPPIEPPEAPEAPNPDEPPLDPEDINNAVGGALGGIKDAVDALTKISDKFVIIDGANYFSHVVAMGEAGDLSDLGIGSKPDKADKPGKPENSNEQETQPSDSNADETKSPDDTNESEGRMKKTVDANRTKIIDGKLKKTNTFKFNSQVVNAGWSDNAMIAKGALNASALAKGHPQLPLYRFDTMDDVNAFKNKFANCFNFDRGFNTAIDELDVNFFNENSLMVVYITSGSGSNRFEVTEVCYDDYLFGIYVSQVNNPGVGTCDMAGWFAIVEVPDKILNDCSDFEAGFATFPD